MKEIPGMTIGESNETYHACDDDSFSDVKIILKSPELYRKHKDGLIPVERKDAWDVGTAVHDRILEPHKTSKLRLVGRYYNGAKKSGKKFKKKVDKRGLTLMSVSNSTTVRNCVSAIVKSNAFKLFNEGDAEVTWRASNGQGVRMQCRTDWICHDAPAGLEAFGIYAGDRYVADLKTTQNLDDWMSESRWKNPLTGDLLYAGQQEFYTPIIDSILRSAKLGKIDAWVFVVVEKKEPFRVGVISAPNNARERARMIINYALGEIAERNKSGDWSDERISGVFTPEINI